MGAHTVSVDCICSGIGSTDQQSVKDSGKGDSDFNDSDSDISGDGGKRNFSTFQPKLKSEFSPLSFDVLSTHISKLNIHIHQNDMNDKR